MDVKIEESWKKILESEFEKLGINIQLFRKSGNVWLQTTTTDHWSIAQQNKEAEKTLA